MEENETFDLLTENPSLDRIPKFEDLFKSIHLGKIDRSHSGEIDHV